MIRPETQQTSWDRYEWVGEPTGAAGVADNRIERDLAGEPRHWNLGSLIFDDGMGQEPRYISPAHMAEGDSALTGGGSNPGGQHWAVPKR